MFTMSEREVDTMEKIAHAIYAIALYEIPTYVVAGRSPYRAEVFVQRMVGIRCQHAIARYASTSNEGL